MGSVAPEPEEALPRIQVLDGRITTGGLQLYRVTGLERDQTLYVHAKATSGHLDPLVALLKPGVDPAVLASESLDALIATLARDHDPIEVTRQILDRYALAGNDDYRGHYYAAFDTVIPADGDYWLVLGSSLVRPSAGTYRLVVGVDEPDVLSGRPEASGPAFVFARKDNGAPERGIVLATGKLTQQYTLRYYNLADLAAGSTLYAFAEALGDDLKPVLTLYDYSEKPVAYANFAATDSRAKLHYELPRDAERYRLRISSQDPTGKITTGNYRLLIGLNAPEVLEGEGDPTGTAVLREPIPVHIGLKLSQITEVNQKSENFGVVATLVMAWQDPALAFDPEAAQDRFKVYTGDTFSAEMSRRGQWWPEFSVVNQQGNRWVQNCVVVITADGHAIYREGFSTTLQAPDFDFRDFPFDQQQFFIRVELLTPEWVFQLREMEGYSEVGRALGEEEWVVSPSWIRC